MTNEEIKTLALEAKVVYKRVKSFKGVAEVMEISLQDAILLLKADVKTINKRFRRRKQ